MVFSEISVAGERFNGNWLAKLSRALKGNTRDAQRLVRPLGYGVEQHGGADQAEHAQNSDLPEIDLAFHIILDKRHQQYRIKAGVEFQFIRLYGASPKRAQ